MGYFVESDPIYSSDEEIEEEIEEELPTDGLMNVFSMIMFYAERNQPILDRCSYADFVDYVENADTRRPMEMLHVEEKMEEGLLEVRKMCKDEWMEERASDVNYIAMLMRKYDIIADEHFPEFVYEHSSHGYVLV